VLFENFHDYFFGLGVNHFGTSPAPILSKNARIGKSPILCYREPAFVFPHFKFF